MRLLPLLLVLFTACSTVPWTSVDGLDEGEDYIRLAEISAKPAPQVFTAIEGDTAPIVDTSSSKELSRGDLLVEIRTGVCAPCDALEKSLTDEKAEELTGAKWLRIEVQGDAADAKVRTPVVPTLVLLRDGTEKARLLGNRKPAELRRFLQDHSFRR